MVDSSIKAEEIWERQHEKEPVTIEFRPIERSDNPEQNRLMKCGLCSAPVLNIDTRDHAAYHIRNRHV